MNHIAAILGPEVGAAEATVQREMKVAMMTFLEAVVWIVNVPNIFDIVFALGSIESDEFFLAERLENAF